MAQTEPTAPLHDNVARLATQSVAFDGAALVLLGTFGSPSRPGALLRLADRTTARVAPGDRLGAVTVLAIADGQVVIETAGKTATLVPPGNEMRRAASGPRQRGNPPWLWRRSGLLRPKPERLVDS